MEQQFDTSKIGMWLFLATEILLFGGLFVGFGLMQHKYPREFIEAHEHLKQMVFGSPFPLYGAINTVVLLVSSWTMVMGVNAAQTNQQKKTVRFLVMTILLACVFLAIKYVEYEHKFHDGLLPAKYSRNWRTASARRPFMDPVQPACGRCGWPFFINPIR